VEENRSVPGLNADALRQLTQTIDERLNGTAQSGQPLLLLTSPRAGYGKTHLLGRLASAAGGQVVLVPLAFRMEDQIGLPAAVKRGLEAMARAETGRAGWTRLREACAGVSASLLRGLIGTGQLPSANPEQAHRVLASNPVEIFDPAGSARLIGEWVRRHGQALTKPLSLQAGQKVAAADEILDAWVNAILLHAQEGTAASSVPLRALANDETSEGSLNFLRMLGLWRPVALLVDHLDAYYRNAEAGLRIASLLLDISELDGIHVLLSLNQDVWQATFGHHLPSALEDRLTASQLLLRGIHEAEALQLMRMRLDIADVTEEQAREFVQFVDVPRYFLGRPLGSVSTRGFLRHLARQWDVFQNTSPSPGDAFAPTIMPDESAEVLNRGAQEPLPSLPEPKDAKIFDDAAAAKARTLAEGLAEPKPALPQELEPPAMQAPELSSQAADAFSRLREMLGKLRQPAAATLATAAAAAPASPTAANEAPTPAAALSPSPAPSSAPLPVHQPDVLLGRYEALRLQLSAEAESQPLDLAKIGELIRLAGRRFPLVRLSEHELPGMTGRQVMAWSLQGLEILFGLASFADAAYWRTLSTFAAGRLASLATTAHASGDLPPRVKLVTFKTDREQQSWSILRMSDAFPLVVESMLDAVHLDSASVSSLYAMQRIIKEAESGALTATPAQVMSVLARELDFFWKRSTRSS
jgi:hypothetical protein